MKPRTAKGQFDVHLGNATDSLALLAQLVDDLAIDQMRDPSNWGYAGSMGHVAAKLAELVEFLGNGREVQ